MTWETCGEELDNCYFVNDMFTDEAINFIEDSAEEENPFFLYLAYTNPHTGMLSEDGNYGYPIPWKYRELTSNDDWPILE